jgi:hypothetical protein
VEHRELRLLLVVDARKRRIRAAEDRGLATANVVEVGNRRVEVSGLPAELVARKARFQLRGRRAPSSESGDASSRVAQRPACANSSHRDEATGAERAPADRLAGRSPTRGPYDVTVKQIDCVCGYVVKGEDDDEL